MIAKHVVACAVAAVALLGATAHASGDSVHINWAHFLDPVGDNGTAPDIKLVTVTNYGGGTVSFDTDFVSGFPGKSEVDVYIDADDNASTGAPNTAGADYLIQDFEANKTIDFSHWNGQAWDDSIPYSSIRITHNTKTSVEIAVNRRQLPGSTANFRFWIASAENKDATADSQFDIAPNNGVWSFSFTPVTVRITDFHVSATNGGLTATAAAIRSDNHELVGPSTGIIGCKATVGGRLLKVTFRGLVDHNDVWGCVWAVPSALIGRTAHGSISIAHQFTDATRSFTVKLR